MKRPKGPRKQSARLVELVVPGGSFTTWYDKWFGLGVFAKRRPDGTQGDGCSARQLAKEKKVKRPQGVSATGLPSLAPYEPSVSLSLFPHLDSLLLDPNWDDATPKGKRCLMAFVDDYSIRILLKLEADCLKMSCVGRGWDEVLAVAEKLIASDQVVWEQDMPRGVTQKKKK
jgi:hypothetical protein